MVACTTTVSLFIGSRIAPACGFEDSRFQRVESPNTTLRIKNSAREMKKASWLPLVMCLCSGFTLLAILMGVSPLLIPLPLPLPLLPRKGYSELSDDVEKISYHDANFGQ
jgi:hypothetical protein